MTDPKTAPDAGTRPEWTPAKLQPLTIEQMREVIWNLKDGDGLSEGMWQRFEGGLDALAAVPSPVVSEAMVEAAMAYDKATWHSAKEWSEKATVAGREFYRGLLTAALGAAPREGEPWRWAIEFAPAGDESERVILDDVLFKSQKEAETECAMRQALHPHDARRAVPVYAAAPVGTFEQQAEMWLAACDLSRQPDIAAAVLGFARTLCAPVGTEGREAVIEECARVCDKEAEDCRVEGEIAEAVSATTCAAMIRALPSTVLYDERLTPERVNNAKQWLSEIDEHPDAQTRAAGETCLAALATAPRAGTGEAR